MSLYCQSAYSADLASNNKLLLNISLLKRRKAKFDKICYTRSAVISLSVIYVCLLQFVSPAKTAEPIENRDAFWRVELRGPKEPSIKWGADPLIPEGKGNLCGCALH